MNVLEIIKGQWSYLPIVPTPETCANTTWIVTGANSGYGLECAKHLVRLGCKRVIMAVRSPERGEAAKQEIESQTGRTGIAEVWDLDLGSFESVKAFAARAVRELHRIDALIENASIALDSWAETEGMEMCVAVNAVGTLLLALLLLPKMREGAIKFNTQPHIVCVGSGVAFMDGQGVLEKIRGNIIDELNDQAASRSAETMKNRYSISKLLQIYAYRELADLLPVEKSGVVINILSPGLSWTGLARHASFIAWLQLRIFNLVLGRSVEKGSRTLLHAGVAGEESHGKLLSDCKIKDYWNPEWVTNESGHQVQKKLWEDTSAKLDEIVPGCVGRALDT